jgi:hypothetical protein
MRKSREKLSVKRSIKGYAKKAKSNKLLELFSTVPDHRKAKGKRHKIEHILYLSVLAGLMGATDYKQISIWIEKHVQKEEVKRLLGVEFVLTPKKSVVSSILKDVNSEAVELIFREWIRNYVDTKGKHLSVDGKVMNGSRYKDKRSIEIVSGVLSEIGVIIAHEKIAYKSNEIPALQAMIGELGDEFIFTFDAMNTQKKL